MNISSLTRVMGIARIFLFAKYIKENSWSPFPMVEGLAIDIRNSMHWMYNLNKEIFIRHESKYLKQ